MRMVNLYKYNVRLKWMRESQIYFFYVLLGLISCGKPTATSVEQVYDITQFGAVGDSITVNTQAIQRAIEACHAQGGGTVVVPKGTFSSGAIFLKDNVSLHVAAGGKLRAVAGLENYPTLDTTRIAGIEMKWPSAFINAIHAKHIKIFGEGVIDGAGYYWWEDYWMKRDSLAATVPGDLIDWYVPRPRLMLLQHVANATIESIHLKNSGFWTVHICYSHHVLVAGVDIVNPVLERGKKAASSDGIDIDSSHDIEVRDSHIAVDDDCIAIKSGRGSDGLRVNIPTENVRITHCFFGSGHGAVSIGTETAGGIRNVVAQNCEADGNHAPIKFKPRQGRGGLIENIIYANWDIKNAGTVIDYALRHADGQEYIDEWQKIVVPFEQATPRYRNITIRNIQAATSQKAISFLGWPLAHAENVWLENIHVQAQQAGKIQYVDNLMLKKVVIDAPQQKLTVENVTNLKSITHDRL